MAAHAVGVDVIEIARVRRMIERYPDRFLRRVYTPLEVAYCRGRVPELAARFAAKEAVMKALGTGLRTIAWRDIEVLPNDHGKPLVLLHGPAAGRANTIGLGQLDISLSHTRAYAVAVVVGEAATIDTHEQTPRSSFLRRGPPPTAGTPHLASPSRQ